MTDHFAVLGEARRPALEAEALKARFLRQSTEVHPDRFHGAAEAERLESERLYSGLNSAYQVLREHRTRLLHLLELESGARPRDVQRIPAGTMDLFVEVGQTCRAADAFLERRGSVTSPMLKVQLFREGLDWTAKLTALQARVNARAAALESELVGMNAVWEAAPPVGSPERPGSLPLVRLEEVYRVFSYIARWTEQIQERLVRLASV
jgi:DnaJ-domain-containing protein 1